MPVAGTSYPRASKTRGLHHRHKDPYEEKVVVLAFVEDEADPRTDIAQLAVPSAAVNNAAVADTAAL
jgi:hypothetical protein